MFSRYPAPLYTAAPGTACPLFSHLATISIQRMTQIVRNNFSPRKQQSSRAPFTSPRNDFLSPYNIFLLYKQGENLHLRMDLFLQCLY